MKKIALLLSIFTLTISCQAPKSQRVNKHSVQEGGNRIVATPPKIDLGQWSKSEKDTVHFQFILTNESDSMTIINNVDVACNCVSISYKAKPILPKESITLQGFVNLKNQTGHLSKAIFVNYGKGELLTLRITADIK